MNPLEPLSAFAIRGRADTFALLLETSPPPLARLLRETGQQLAAVAVPGERFRADLRTRLLAVAAVRAASTSAAPARTAVSWRARSRAGSVAAGALASVVAVTGVAVAGEQSLPGDLFYGVKRTTEAFSLRTADGNLGRGTRHLEFAATRLGEVRGLTLGRDAVSAAPPTGSVLLVNSASQLSDGAALGNRVADRVRQTLADMDADTLRGQSLLSAAFRSSSDDAPLQALSRFATRQSAGLERLLPSLPAASRQRALTSLALVTEVGERTQALLGPAPCSATCDPSAAAPAAPVVVPPSADPLEPGTPAPGATSVPCGCEPSLTPAPDSDPSASQDPQSVGPEPSGAASPGPKPSSGPAPSATPQPSPSPTGLLPSPLPSLPLPLPTPPLPLPSLPPPNTKLPNANLPSANVPSGSSLSGSVLPALSSLSGAGDTALISQAPLTVLFSGPSSSLLAAPASLVSTMSLFLPPSLSSTGQSAVRQLS